MTKALSECLENLRIRLLSATESPIDDAEFHELAIQIACAQAEALPLLRASIPVDSPIDDCWGIPTMPTRGFKEWSIFCHGDEPVARTFLSSGTTQSDRSRHQHTEKTLATYHLAALQGFRSFFGEEAPKRMVSLCPPREIAPTSSLVDMFTVWLERFGDEQSTALGTVAPNGDWSLAVEPLLSCLDVAIRDNTPVFLMGAAFHYVWLLDALPHPIVLPQGSLILETGGYKGRSRELPRDALHRSLREKCGIAASSIVSEYGMSELSSQGYARFGDGGGLFRFPSWVRARCVSPETGDAIEDNGVGILEIIDLANVASTIAIQTQDLARPHPDGFEILGRSPDEEPKGCSLFVES